MKSSKPSARVSIAITGLLACLCTVSLFGQAKPASSHSSSTTTMKSENDAIQFCPFEVTTDRDVGYQATSTQAGGRLNMNLKDASAVVGIMTNEFLQDIGAASLESFIGWAANMNYEDAENAFNVVYTQLPQVRARSLGAHVFTTTKN